MSTDSYDYRDINDYAHMPDLDDAGARAYYKEIHFQNGDADEDDTTEETSQTINMMRKGRWRNKLNAGRRSAPRTDRRDLKATGFTPMPFTLPPPS
jgi:hypothetical protein